MGLPGMLVEKGKELFGHLGVDLVTDAIAPELQRAAKARVELSI